MTNKGPNLTAILNKMNKAYPRGVYHLNEIPPYDVVPTGSLALDYALDIGGWPTGRVVEPGGEPGVGKTTIMLNTAENYNKYFPGRAVAFIDMEHRLETEWAESFISDSSRFIVLKPDSAEQAVKMYRDLATTGDFSAIIWDSIGGSPTTAAFEASKNGSATKTFAGNSGIITEFAKQAMVLSGKYNMTTFGINQVRADMGGYNRYTTPGGKAWEHACSLRVQFKKSSDSVADKNIFEKINGEDIRVAYEVTAKVVKSSVGKPGRIATYWFHNVKNDLGFGVDRVEETSRLATLTGVVERRGGWLYHELLDGGKIQGGDAFAKFLKGNQKALNQISEQTMAAMKSGKVDMSDIIPTSHDPESALPTEEQVVFSGAKSLRQLAEEAE